MKTIEKYVESQRITWSCQDYKPSGLKEKIPTTDNDRIINQNITATAEDRQETCFNEISCKVKLRQVPNRSLSCNKRRGPVLHEYEKEYYLLITNQLKRSSLKRFFFASGNRNCFTVFIDRLDSLKGFGSVLFVQLNICYRDI